MVTRSTLPLILGFPQLYKVHSTSCTLPLLKTCLQCCVGFAGFVISSTVDAALQSQQPSKAHTAHLHCLVGVLTLLSR